MNTDCVNCKHARLWTDAEKLEYINEMLESLGRLPTDIDHYICDKMPKGSEWTENGNTYQYDGYSLDGENYDEVFGCFEQRGDTE